MKLLNNFKQGLIHGIGFLTILGLAGITYAAFNFNDTITEVPSNGTLSSAEYNKLVKKLNMIDENQLATAWVKFDGVTGTIRDSFNISGVTKLGYAHYLVNLSNFDNPNYVVIGKNSNSNIGTRADETDINFQDSMQYDSGGFEFYTSINNNNSSARQESGVVTLVFYGGKD